jgi:hypothetical protein
MARYQIAEQLGSYRVGDTPGDVSFGIESDGEPVTLDAVTDVAAEFAGATVAATFDTTAETVTVTLPALASAGVQYLELTFTVGLGLTVQVDPAALVTEESDGWHSLGTARGEWRDAPALDVQLYTVLEVAKAQCLEYGPDLVDGTGLALPVPFTWRQAQIMQARNVWNAAKTDPASGGIGGDDFIIRPYPMDQTIRYILRPKRAIGAIA